MTPSRLKPPSQVRILPGHHSDQRKRWLTHRPTYPLPLAHLRTAADSLAENRTQIVGLSVDLAANTPTVVATEVVISSHAGI
jgi:hypothetical protein